MAGREYPLERTRNIGIMAHIDAGQDYIDRAYSVLYRVLTTKSVILMKVTATMDWMEQEQERGITITSAATTCTGLCRRTASRSLVRWRTVSISLILRDTLTSLWKLSVLSVYLTALWVFSAQRAVLSRSQKMYGARRIRTMYRVCIHQQNGYPGRGFLRRGRADSYKAG